MVPDVVSCLHTLRCMYAHTCLKHILAEHTYNAVCYVQDVAEAKIIEAHASEKRQQPQVGTG